MNGIRDKRIGDIGMRYRSIYITPASAAVLRVHGTSRKGPRAVQPQKRGNWLGVCGGSVCKILTALRQDVEPEIIHKLEQTNSVAQAERAARLTATNRELKRIGLVGLTFAPPCKSPKSILVSPRLREMPVHTNVLYVWEPAKPS